MCHRKSAKLDLTLLSVSHVCLQTCISCQPYWFYNFIQLLQFNCEMKLKVDLWLDWSYFVFGMSQYTLFPIDFNGKLEIFLKHFKKKKFFLKVCVCVNGLWLFFRLTQALHYLMSTLFFFLCTSTQITLKFFHVSHVSHVSAMLNFKFFFGQVMCWHLTLTLIQ